MQTIREFGDFYKDALSLLGEDGYKELIDAIARNPLAGEEMRGTGGFRKLRWARPGMGKRGGVRTVYFYLGTGSPISMVAIYAKSDKESLTKAQENALYTLAQCIKKGD